jgi:DNA-binding NtrC family response regulator
MQSRPAHQSPISPKPRRNELYQRKRNRKKETYMQIAVLAHDYHTVRVIEMLLEREQHTVSCFGKLEQLECSKQTFDVLLFDPGNLEAAGAMLQRLTGWRPKMRRILVTHFASVAVLARQKKQPILFLPCSRRLFLALVENKKPLEWQEVSRGT